MSPKSEKSKKKLMFKKKVNKSKLADDKISGLKEQYKNVSYLWEKNPETSNIETFSLLISFQIDSKKVKNFADLPLSEETKKGLAECDYEVPTEIQRESIALCLKGLDILGK